MKEEWVTYKEAPPAASKSDEPKAEAAAEKKDTEPKERRPVPTSFAAIATAGPIREEVDETPDAATAAAALTDALQDCLGVPLVLVLSKTDCAAAAAEGAAGAASVGTSQRVERAEEAAAAGVKLAEAQCCLREAALRYGASVVFASSKTQRNVDVLLATLGATLLGAQRVSAHQVYDRAATVVPAGWDSAKKLELDFPQHEQLMRTLREAPASAAQPSATPEADKETCMDEAEFLAL